MSGTTTTATVTVDVDEQGRCYIPKPARKKLGIDGVEAVVEMTVTVDE